MKKWIKSILIDATLLFFIYYAVIEDYLWAYNIAIFIIWFFIILRILHCLLPEKKYFEIYEIRKAKSKLFTHWNHFMDVVIILILVGSSWAWSGFFLLITKLIMMGRDVSIEEKETAKEQP